MSDQMCLVVGWARRAFFKHFAFPKLTLLVLAMPYQRRSRVLVGERCKIGWRRRAKYVRMIIFNFILSHKISVSVYSLIVHDGGVDCFEDGRGILSGCLATARLSWSAICFARHCPSPDQIDRRVITKGKLLLLLRAVRMRRQVDRRREHFVALDLLNLFVLSELVLFPRLRCLVDLLDFDPHHQILVDHHFMTFIWSWGRWKLLQNALVDTRHHCLCLNDSSVRAGASSWRKALLSGCKFSSRIERPWRPIAFVFRPMTIRKVIIISTLESGALDAQKSRLVIDGTDRRTTLNAVGEESFAFNCRHRCFSYVVVRKGFPRAASSNWWSCRISHDLVFEASVEVVQVYLPLSELFSLIILDFAHFLI